MLPGIYPIISQKENSHSKMNKKTDIIFFHTGAAMVISEIWKQLYLTFAINHGQYDWWYFPFQLCSLPMYLLVMLPLLRSRKIRTVIYTFLMDYVLLSGIFVFFDIRGLFYPRPLLTLLALFP